MSDNENKNIGDKVNSNEVNIDKESAFLRELLFGEKEQQAPAEDNVASDSETDIDSSSQAEPEDNGTADSADISSESESNGAFDGFSDFLTDSGEPKEEKSPENEYSSHFKTDSYNTEDMPHFFTESSEYEDEQPLDVSDFYPPVKSDDDLYYDNDDTKQDFADFSETLSSVSDSETHEAMTDIVSDSSEPTDFSEPITEFEPAVQDTDSDDRPLDFDLSDILSEAAESDDVAPDDEKTRVFDAINDDFANESNTDIDATRVAEPITKSAEKSSPTAEKKPNIFVRFLSGLFPWKGDSKKEVARKIVLIAAYITIIAMGWQILSYYVFDPMRNNALTEKLHEMYVPKDEDYSSPEINPKFRALYELNNDIVGWIKVRDTNIDYPVIKGDTNEEYERHDIYHNYTRYGSIFMESSCSIDYGAESRNIIVYGHNMKDDSSMFSQLTHYRDFEFYKNHATFIFDSLYNDGTWKIFSIMTTNAYPAQDDGQYFDFRKTGFVDDAEFNSWIEGCRIRSCINTGVDVLPTDTIITLQSCVYEFTDARLVIMARRARPGESKDVDVSKAVVNPNPRYPQAWYDAKGITNPYAGGNIPDDANYLPNAAANKSYSYILDNTAGVTNVNSTAPAASTVVSAADATQPQPIVIPDNGSDSSYRPSSGSAVQRTTVRTPQPTTKKPQSTTKKTQSTTKKPQSTTSKPNVTAAPTQAPTKAPTQAPTQAPTEEYEPNAPY